MLVSVGCRSVVIVFLIVSSLELSGCASAPRSRSLESSSNLIYKHDQWAQEYEEVGNQEMSDYHKQKADEERELYDRRSSDLFEIFFTVIFDGLLGGTKE